MEQADIIFPGNDKGDCVITTTQLCYAGDNYEEEIDHETGTTIQRHYIRGSTGLTAVFIANDDSAKTDNLYYIHQDYLGSILCLSDEEGNPVERYSFDAWGHRRNPTNWSKWQGDSTDYIVNRGFTGHEHMDVFGLINMNGRIYDPGLGRFLSPDPYVQMPDNSQNFNRYSYALNNPLIYTDPSGEFIFTAATLIAAPFTGGASLALLPAAIGADFGTWQGGTLANEGEMNPFKWDYSSGKTWGYMLGGAAVGAASGYVGGAIAAEGGFMANTMGIITASHVNSVGMGIVSGGQTDYTLSFGVASITMGSQGFEFGYLGKPGNSALENIGYSFGALANLTDVVSLFGSGTNIDVNSADTKKPHEWWGHSSATDQSGKINVSVGPESQNYSTKMEYFSIKGGKSWPNYAGKSGTWSVRVNNVNANLLETMTSNIAAGKGLYGIGQLKWNILGFSCVNHVSRALWAVGVPTLPINIHPLILNTQLFIRQAGIYSSPYLNNF